MKKGSDTYKEGVGRKGSEDVLEGKGRDNFLFEFVIAGCVF
jgi:hypothetical protein